MDQYRLLKACLLRGLGSALLIASETYAYALFLSAYPQKNIPYLYLSLAFFAFLGMQLSQPFLKKDLAKFMQISNLFFSAGLAVFVFFIHQGSAWVPFVFAIFVITAVTITNTTNWIAVTALFNLREFKTVNAWVSSSSTMGSIMIGLLIPLLLKYFNSISVLYLIIGLFLLTLIISYFLRFPVEKPEPKRHRGLAFSLNRDALFISTFIALLVMLVLFTFADFSMKSELARNFNKHEIGQFLAPFFAITSIITILIQILILPGMLRRFGVVGLIMACPIFYLVVAGVVLIYPSLWTATLLAGTAMILRYSFFMMGNQMLLNVYPRVIQYVAKYQAESYGRSLGTAIGALFLIGFVLIGDLRAISLGIVFAAIILIFVTIKLKENYFGALKNAINLHRFDTDFLSTERANKELILKVASQALAEHNEETMLFGLSLFRKMKLKQVPPTVIAALSSEFDTVKKSAIRVVEDSGNESVVPSLMKQLALEKNSEISWHLVNGVLHFSPDFLISYAKTAILSDDPPIKAAAIAVFLQTGEEAEIQVARESFSIMINHPEARYRYWAANILKTGALKNPHGYVLKLMNDPDDRVVRNVLFAATLCPDELIIATLIKKLSKKGLVHSVGKTLVRIGPRIIPELLKQAYHFQNFQQMRPGMLLFSRIEAPEAELALLDLLLNLKGELLDKCVIALAYRAKQFELSKKARRIIEQEILREVEQIQLLQSYLSNYQEIDVQNEIRSRIFYARKRYLYLLASIAEPKIIMQIIPTILSASHDSRGYISSTELLELCVNKQVLKDSISFALESKSQTLHLEPKQTLFDDWLKQVIDFKQGIEPKEVEQKLIETVLTLRKASLFSFLSAEMLKNIAGIVHRKKIEMAAVIFKEGEPGDGMYIVIKGHVNIIKRGRTIRFLGPSSFFGELALLDNEPRYAEALAQEETELFFIEKNDFIRLTDEVPEILKAVTKTIIGYLRDREQE